METNSQRPERLVLTIEETATMLGISRGTAYLLAKTGGIPAIRISKRRLVVPRKALDAFLLSGARVDKDRATGKEAEERCCPK